jgi:hypothetical protein
MDNKVTTRLGNQDLVNIARQQYENKQKSKLPSVIVKLASGGKIYPKNHPLRSGQLEMRYMTAYDEDILTNASYITEGVVFDKLLESIILTPININDICAVDKDGLILHARIMAYGPEYAVKIQDPKTKKMLNRIVDLTEVQFKPFDLVSDDNGEFSYKVNEETTIKFSYPSSQVDNDTVTQLITNLITEVNGIRERSVIDQFIRYDFLARDAKRFREYVKSNAPGIDYEINFEGEDGSTFKSMFPIGSDLFWF